MRDILAHFFHEYATFIIASLVFTATGVALLIVATFVRGPGAGPAPWILYVLGGMFLLIGILGVLGSAGIWWARNQDPMLELLLAWWANFGIGMLAAGLFAVPATCMGPVFLAAYFLRPNALFPPGADLQNLWVGLLFSLVGLITLVGMFLIGWLFLRGRPKR